MAQPAVKLALQAMRPINATRDPTKFFQMCRGIATATPSRRPILSSAVTKSTVSNVRPKRPLSTTKSLRATAVLKNPRVDEDGNDMIIEISDRAAKRLKQLTSTPPPKNTLVASSDPADAHLRVTVTSGGCHGFQYLMALEPEAKIDAEEDTIFGAENAEGMGKAQVVMDSASLELLKGSTIDFTTELIGSQFKIVGNPRATSSCGCGTSFDIE